MKKLIITLIVCAAIFGVIYGTLSFECSICQSRKFSKLSAYVVSGTDSLICEDCYDSLSFFR